MTLVDTSVWIEFLRGKDKALNDQMIELLENRLVVGLSTVFGELIQGVRSDEEEKVILEFWQYLPKVNEENLFIEAGKISNRLKLTSKGVGLIDCHLLAAAFVYSLRLWTLDKRLSEAYSRMLR